MLSYAVVRHGLLVVLSRGLVGSGFSGQGFPALSLNPARYRLGLS